MSNCSQHKKEVAGISDMKVLAEMIGDLHYQSLEVLLDELQIKINHDAYKDHFEGRVKLSAELTKCVVSLRAASLAIGRAWKISKPYMESSSNKEVKQ